VGFNEKLDRMIAELHVHSNHSDGRDSVKKLLESAIEKRIGAISITDHDTINGSLEAVELVNEEYYPLMVIPGIEISTDDGHLLAYGVEKEFDPGMSMEDTIREVRKAGGVSVVAHPFQIHRHGILSLKKVIRAVDAIEVFNAKFYIGICNKLANRIAEKYGIPGIAGSDAHSAKSVGYGLTILYNANTSHSAIEDIRYGFTGVIGCRIPISIQFKTSTRDITGWISWKKSKE